MLFCATSPLLEVVGEEFVEAGLVETDAGFAISGGVFPAGAAPVGVAQGFPGDR